MKINDKYTITTDARNFIVTEKSVSDSPKSKTGFKYDESYHPNFKRASQHIINSCIGDCEELKDVISHVDGVLADINDANMNLVKLFVDGLVENRTGILFTEEYLQQYYADFLVEQGLVKR